LKLLFAILFGIMLFASVATVLTQPDAQTEVPVIYWVTDPNPARIEQIALFHEWLVKNGHTTADGKPCVELRLDTATDPNKKIIQGVAGVAGDIIDCHVNTMVEIGLLHDVTDDAKRLGFDMSHTYAALDTELTVDGRQYGFPCNVNVMGFWVNVDTFAKIGMKPPPRSWDFDTFERIGNEFCEKANAGKKRRTVFFANSATSWTGERWVCVMHRSLGLSVFNETTTACTLDDPRYAEVLARIYKWTYVDNILPNASDEASASSEAGYGGSVLSLFQHGHYGMITIGRWCLIRIREFENPPNLSVSHLPYDKFPNALIGARPAGVYRGGRHKDLAVLFLAFLASDDYNLGIVADADALPPSPALTNTEAFLRPPGHENEWGCHEVPVEAGKTIALGSVYSPFVPMATTNRIALKAREKVMAGMATPAEAARETAERINEEIARTIAESKTLQAKYDALVAVQRKIDAKRKAGGKIPTSWIRNRFLRRYYAWKGCLEENE